MYDQGRYFTFTGRIFGQERPIAERSAEVIDIHQKHLAKKPKAKHAREAMPVDMGDDELFQVI